MNLFNQKYQYIFMPEGVELISTILQNIGHSDFTSKKAREDGLKVIAELFKLNLIEIFHWGKYNNLISNLNLDNTQSINFIENVWFVGADFKDFIDMPMFKYKEWYLESLYGLGYTNTTDWKSFFEKKIGNIEKWLDTYRPSNKE